MKMIDGLSEGDLEVTEDTHIDGHWDGFITVRQGAYLHFVGSISGGLNIDQGGKAEVDALLEGSIVVFEGGTLSFSGIHRGSVEINDGTLLVQAGSAMNYSQDTLQAQRVLEDATFGSAAEDGPKTSRAMLRVHGTGSDLTLSRLG